jgi:hypothetical protein
MADPKLPTGMLRRAEDQLDIPTKSEKHLEQSLDGKAFDFPRKQQGHLRRRVANDTRGLGLIQVMVTNDRRDLLRQLFLWNEVFLASVTAWPPWAPLCRPG